MVKYHCEKLKIMDSIDYTNNLDRYITIKTKHRLPIDYIQDIQVEYLYSMYFHYPVYYDWEKCTIVINGKMAYKQGSRYQALIINCNTNRRQPFVIHNYTRIDKPIKHNPIYNKQLANIYSQFE